MARIPHTYRQNPKNQDELFEMMGATGTPTGRIFRKVSESEVIDSGMQTVSIPDPLTRVLTLYVLSRLG